MRNSMHRSAFVIGFGMIAISVLAFPVYADDPMTAQTFVTYRSDQPRLPVSFEYPADWSVEYSTGAVEAYAQVQIYGPKSLEKRLRTYLVVRAMPQQTQGGHYADVGEMIDQYRKTLPPTLHIDQERQTTVLGEPTPLLEVSGSLLLPWNSQKAQPVPVRSERIFFEKNDRLYELAWMATPEASSTLAAAFSHLLQTLVLLE